MGQGQLGDGLVSRKTQEKEKEMIKIGDKVVAHIFHMSAVGILMEIDGTEYRVRVGQHDYWVDCVTPA